jgi:hypothetical protein
LLDVCGTLSAASQPLRPALPKAASAIHARKDLRFNIGMLLDRAASGLQPNG